VKFIDLMHIIIYAHSLFIVA